MGRRRAPAWRARAGVPLGSLAAVVAAVSALVAEQIDYEDDGAEFTSAWLGAQRSTALPYWHWMDGSEVWLQNYTNWYNNFKVRYQALSSSSFRIFRFLIFRILS